MVLPALRIWKAVRARLAKRVFRRPGNRSRFYRPLLEALEERWVLSTITVLNNLDSGAGSLRDAIDNLAVSGDTIDFAAGLAGQTITLTSGELAINKNLIITGLGANLLSISGSHASRIFDISSDVSISGLTLTAGQATNANGGAISVSGGPLTITDCAFTDNTAD